jgi:TPR repeat protein
LDHDLDQDSDPDQGHADPLLLFDHRWTLASASNGSAESLFRAAVRLGAGGFGPQGRGLAAPLFREAADKGDRHARAVVRHWCGDGAGPKGIPEGQAPGDRIKALEAECLRQRMSRSPDPGLPFFLGIAFSAGIGVEIDRRKAFAFFREAAGLGSGDAAYELFRMLPPSGPEGRGGRARLLLAAAEAGSPQAQLELGLALRDGEFGSEDRGAAMLWLGFAARRNVARASYELGLMEAEDDPGSAMARIQKASDLGDHMARLFLSFMDFPEGRLRAPGAGAPPVPHGKILS